MKNTFARNVLLLLKYYNMGKRKKIISPWFMVYLVPKKCVEAWSRGFINSMRITLHDR